MSDDFSDLLESAFPHSTWPLLVRAKREGIALADDVRRNTPLLNNLLGRDLRGQLRRIGVMTQLQKYCASGDLPFAAEIDHMPHGTWHWLNLRSGAFIAHVARTDVFREVPEDTKNRQHYLVKNDPDLFEVGKITPITEITATIDRFYAYLTFGSTHEGKLTHATLGMADRDGFDWLAQHNLLRAAGEGLASQPDAAPKFDPKDRIKFTEQVQELLNLERDRTEDKK